MAKSTAYEVMFDLEEAFNQITTFSFLFKHLQEAVDTNKRQKIVDITAAINAFYTPYCDNFDEKFAKLMTLLVDKKDNEQIT